MTAARIAPGTACRHFTVWCGTTRNISVMQTNSIRIGASRSASSASHRPSWVPNNGMANTRADTARDAAASIAPRVSTVQ